MSILPNTPPDEAAYHLAGIMASISSKGVEFLGMDTTLLDAAAARLTAGMKTDYGSLAAAISGMQNANTKEEVSGACKGTAALRPIAEAYLLGRVIDHLGYSTNVTQVALAKAFPELKPPKARRIRKKARYAARCAVSSITTAYMEAGGCCGIATCAACRTSLMRLRVARQRMWRFLARAVAGSSARCRLIPA